MLVRSMIVAEKNKNPEKIDMPFVILVLILCGLGMTTLYSGTVGYANRLFGDPLYFIKRQALNLIAGICVLFVSASVNFDAVRKRLPALLVFTIILSLMPFIPGIGISRNGASRWINLGFSTFQPSELIKIVIVIYLAHIFAKKHDRLDEPEVSVYPAAMVTFLFTGLVYLQNDFSTAFFILLVSLSIFFLAGVSIFFFIKLCLVCIPFLLLMILSKEYRVERILSFFRPGDDPLGAGYQVNASINALREGGFWGRGLGNGIKKIASIPEVQSDFIFAVWGEEMGFIGVFLYICLLCLFAWRGFLVSMKCNDRFRSLLAFGCTVVILLQSLLNCSVVVRLLPATGIPLPFFSSGGSSLLITLCLCGCIINVSRWKNRGEFENV